MQKNSSMMYFLVIFVLFIIFGTLAFHLKKKQVKFYNNHNLTFKEFILGYSPVHGVKKWTNGWKTVLGGMMFGIIFGFLDNYYLMSGLSVFDKILPKDPSLKAGWGNTWSDFMGATLGTFIGEVAITYFDINSGTIPIWVNTVGIFIGCILGMYIPYWLGI